MGALSLASRACRQPSLGYHCFSLLQLLVWGWYGNPGQNVKASDKA